MPSQAAQQFRDLIIELSEEYAVDPRSGDPSTLSQSQMRMRVRALFATLEALIYVWKQMALEYHPDPDCKVLTQVEIGYAQEQEFKLNDKGQIETAQAKIPLWKDIRFAYRLLAKAGNVPSELDVSGTGWEGLQKAIKVRDRITHPKSTRDLVLTEDECKTVSHAFGWVVATFLNLQTRMTEQANRNLQSGDAQQAS